MTVGVGGELSADPQKRLFEVVVTLGRDIIILEILPSVELNIFRTYSTFLAINFVTT